MQTEPNHVPKDNASSEQVKAHENRNSNGGDKERGLDVNFSLQSGSLDEGACSRPSCLNPIDGEHFEIDIVDGNLETDGKRIQVENFQARTYSDFSCQSKTRATNPFLFHLPVQNDHMLNPEEAEPIFGGGGIQSNCRGRAVPIHESDDDDDECAAIAQARKDEVKYGRVQWPLEDPSWTLLPNSYVENNGYRLGLKHCRHFEGADGIVVEVQNGKNFEIILGNLNRTRCNVDILVDGKLVAEIQLRKKQMEFLLQGPVLTIDDCDKKFVFLRSRDAPAEAGIDVHCADNGIVEARFMPEKEPEVKLARTRVAERENERTKTLEHIVEEKMASMMMESAVNTANLSEKVERLNVELNAARGRTEYEKCITTGSEGGWKTTLTNAAHMCADVVSKLFEVRQQVRGKASAGIYECGLVDKIDDNSRESPFESGAYAARPDLWCGGAVALQQSDETRVYDQADCIKIDKEKTVILKLRMVARIDDESKPKPSKAITPLYKSITPPPLPI